MFRDDFQNILRKQFKLDSSQSSIFRKIVDIEPRESSYIPAAILNECQN